VIETPVDDIDDTIFNSKSCYTVLDLNLLDIQRHNLFTNYTTLQGLLQWATFGVSIDPRRRSFPWLY
jgi:hypothetical protein